MYTELKDDITASVDRRMDRMEKAIDIKMKGIRADMGIISQKTAQMVTTIDDMEEKIGDLELMVRENKSEIQQVNKKMDQILTRMENMEKRMDIEQTTAHSYAIPIPNDMSTIVVMALTVISAYYYIKFDGTVSKTKAPKMRSYMPLSK